MEGKLSVSDDTARILFEDGSERELKPGDEFEVLVFTALIRFEWVRVRLAENEDGLYLMSPGSRQISYKNISKVRM